MTTGPNIVRCESPSVPPDSTMSTAASGLSSTTIDPPQNRNTIRFQLHPSVPAELLPDSRCRLESSVSVLRLALRDIACTLAYHWIVPQALPF